MQRDFQFFGTATDEGFVEHDREEVRQTLLDLEGALHTLGGAVTISAVRQQVSDDAYVTTGMLIRYQSFSPAAKRPEEPEAEIVTSDAT